jgi:hypothetical protein
VSTGVGRLWYYWSIRCQGMRWQNKSRFDYQGGVWASDTQETDVRA